MSQEPRSFEGRITKPVGCRYLLAPPAGADRPETGWPMVLFLHGAGERGNDLDRVCKHGPPKLVAQGRTFPFVLVSPQCPAHQWWHTDMLNALVDEVVAGRDVDENRIYVTGMSMGGFGTWSLALAYPDRFAAIAPICGGGPPYVADRLGRLPVRAFHGAKDEIVPLYESQRMVDALRACGGDAELTVYPDAGHDSWTQTYDDPAFWEWLLAQRRVRE